MSIIALLFMPLFGLQESGQPNPATSMVTKTFEIPAGRVVKAVLRETLKGGELEVGANVDLRLAEDIKDPSTGIVLIPAGAPVTGSIRYSSGFKINRTGTHGGVLGLGIEYLRQDDTHSIALVAKVPPKEKIDYFWIKKSKFADEPPNIEFNRFFTAEMLDSIETATARLNNEVDGLKLGDLSPLQIRRLRNAIYAYKDIFAGLRAGKGFTSGFKEMFDPLFQEIKSAGSIAEFLRKSTLGTLINVYTALVGVYEVYQVIKQKLDQQTPIVFPGATFEAILKEPTTVSVTIVTTLENQNLVVGAEHPSNPILGSGKLERADQFLSVPMVSNPRLTVALPPRGRNLSVSRYTLKGSSAVGLRLTAAQNARLNDITFRRVMAEIKAMREHPRRHPIWGAP